MTAALHRILFFSFCFMCVIFNLNASFCLTEWPTILLSFRTKVSVFIYAALFEFGVGSLSFSFNFTNIFTIRLDCSTICSKRAREKNIIETKKSIIEFE